MSDSLNYRCNSCGHMWEGDEFTLDCENCSSSDIEIAKDLTQRIKPEDLKDDKTVSSEEKPQTPPVSDDSGTIVIPKAPSEPEQPKQPEPPKEEKPKAAPAPEPKPAPAPKPEPKPAPEPKPEPVAKKAAPAAATPKADAPKPPSGGGGNNTTGGGSEKKSGSSMWIIIVVILALAAGGAYFFLSGEEGANKDDKKEEVATTKVELKLKVEKRDDAFFLSGSVIEGNKESTLALGDITRLYRVSDDQDFKFDEETGQIYFCEDMEGATVFNAELADKKVDEVSSDMVELSLFGKPAPEAANCVYRLQDDKIEVTFLDKCMMEVKINDKYPFKSLTVSITGKDGPFKPKFKWDVSAQSQKTVDVWVKQDDLAPIAYEQNGTLTVPLCIQANPTPDGGGGSKPTVNLEQIIRDITEAATKFGLNPRDRASASKLQELSMSLSSQPRFVIDGQTISGFSAGTNRMKTDFRNDGTTFILDGVPQIVDNKYFKISYRSK